MKTEKNIFIAFVLNFIFAIFEFVGGIFTGSVAIISDAVHDIGDAASIGAAFFLEKKSKKQPDEAYTYGYARYSVLGSAITTLILLAGSILVIYNAIQRIITPTQIDYNGMIIFAIVGVCVNFTAALFTHGGGSLNQKAVNLHMLEDVLGWVVVLIGALIMRFTDFYILDPLMSIGVAVFILANALKNAKAAVDIFLEKTPSNVDVLEIKRHIEEIDGVADAHHIHIWSMDGQSHYATMHIVAKGNFHEIKDEIRRELKEHGISHVTLEMESVGENCHEKICRVDSSALQGHCQHHHHHHHHHH